MTVSPETLDTALCEWCPNSTEATAKVESLTPEYNNLTSYLCNTHANEAASEMLSINLYPLANKPHYTLLESGAEPMTGEWTVAELETAARYGAPYPVCGDLTTRKGNK